MPEPAGFERLSPREQADIERRRNEEDRRWFLEFKVRWLRDNGIIEVRGRPAEDDARHPDD